MHLICYTVLSKFKDEERYPEFYNATIVFMSPKLVAAYQEKNALLAAILSFLFPGLGHIYLGLNKKGISFIIAYIVSAILILLFVGIVLCIIVWLWALIDSIKSAEALNRGEFVEDKLF